MSEVKVTYTKHPTDAFPFHFTSIGLIIPEIWPKYSFFTLKNHIQNFQTLTLKLQGHGCGQRARSYSQPGILLISFLFISHQSDQQFLRYSYFEIWPWKIDQRLRSWVRSKVKVTYTKHPTDAFPFHFTSIGLIIPEIWPKYLFFTLKKTHPKFLTHWGRDKMAAICQATFSNTFSWMKMHEFRLRFHKFVPRIRINNMARH